MKIILSRKGFDSTAGGIPSPILPNGTLLSLPIPAKQDNLSYSDIAYDGVLYSDILAQLKPKDKKIGHWNCHLDPDIREDIRVERLTDWTAAFGQYRAPQSYLANQMVGKGDIFLFFGWFRQTEGDFKKGTLSYVKDAPDLQVLYGFLQVGDLVTDKQCLQENYSWHPHSLDHFTSNASNMLYLPTDRLSLNPELRGYGTFNYADKRVLTMPGHSRATWKEIPALLPENINKHVKNSSKTKGLYYAGQWQELVLKETKISELWCQDVFKDD